VLLFGVTAGHKLGLALVCGAFIVFALVTSMVVPRFRPDFPGRNGVKLYTVVTLIFFVGALAAIEGFAKEKPEIEREAATGAVTTTEVSQFRGGGGTQAQSTVPATTSAGNTSRVVTITATEFKFTPSTTSFGPGSYRFVLKNAGKISHDLVISGPQVNNAQTPVIGPGKTAAIRVALTSGTYELYCSVPGHKAAGMDLKIKVSGPG
jgi:uncharacterized cupredoxin-like copper-binding protein